MERHSGRPGLDHSLSGTAVSRLGRAKGARQGLAAFAGAGAADPAAVRMRRLCLRQPGEHRQRPFCAF